jgi:hypothetical protein
MSKLSNDYSQLYDEIGNGSIISNLSQLTDANSSNLSLSLGIKKNFTGNNNLIIANTLNSSDLNINNNVCVGTFSGQQLNNSNTNTSIGYSSLNHAQNSSDNVACGHKCLSSVLQLCDRNTGLGDECLKNLSNGAHDNCCIGLNCCSDAVSSQNLTCIGNNIRSNDRNNSIAIGSYPLPGFLNISTSNGLFFPGNIAEVPNSVDCKLFAISSNGQAGPIDLAHSNGFLRFDNSIGYVYDNPDNTVVYSSFAYLSNTSSDFFVSPNQTIPYDIVNEFIFYGPNLRRPLDNSKYVEVLISGTYQIDVSYEIIADGLLKLNKPAVYLRQYNSDRSSYVPVYISPGMFYENLSDNEIRHVKGSFIFPALAGQFIVLYVENLDSASEFNLKPLVWKITAL